ncbi:MAG: translation initiation factor IF-2 [Desulfobacterales bacterium RIFOXYA12_FULL_46_15]|nr:MAG: translation initiation factor IF-2 [Desulfobacula sp. GWF2_41_7]OGR23308.1 MAG: translation initiation factor IF-2 [Desulfobacterales bacterium RIFOXYA12_FULL_46_15]
MAKIRVYELAKDLNMTNTALLNKMKELRIEVKSHMSSLEDSDISAVRRSMFGKEKGQNDLKIKPSVIRRRRPHSDDITGPEEHEEIKTAEKEDPTPDVEPEIREEASITTAMLQSTKIVEPKIKKDRPTIKKSEPARIIKPAVIPPPVGLEPIKKDPIRLSEAVSAPEAILQAVPSPIPDSAQETEAIKETEKESKTEEMVLGPDNMAEPVILIDEKLSENQHETFVENEIAVTEIDPLNIEDRDGKAKKKKKKKKSTPAKIVKIADPSVLENLRKPSPIEDKKWPGPKTETRTENPKKKPFIVKEQFSSSFHETPEKEAPLDGIITADEIDSGKWKKEKKPDIFDDDSLVFGKKKQRKQKSVIEGEALYNTTHSRKKRGKKETKGNKKGKFQKTQITTPKAIKRRIKIDEAIELAELAKRMGIKANEMIAKLMTLGVMATVNQTIDFDTAVLVATEFEFEVERASFEEETLLHVEESDDDEDKLIERAPVVTIMGHVDHGKTSLLDVIRKSKIASGEAGGITQHIGAYNVQTPKGGRVTFLDTPGHAAFTAMRSRGAQVTDIVILVVAADDGVMPQTIEAINHSKAAGVPVVVAINKMDKPGADPDRIMRELSEHDLLSEEWGGNVIFVKVSAKTGKGIDELLEMILLQSEVLELKANPNRKATGYVVESRLDVGRGAIATVLVKQGTLRDGDPIVCGLHSGRIRVMIDDAGNRIKEAGPSTPAEIVGLNGIPNAGDEFISVASEKDAKQIAGHRMQKQRAKELAKKSRANLEKMFENLGAAEVKELKLIVKADVHGSIEALNDSLKDLAKEEVDVKIVHSGTGTINESDVSLAAVSDAIIIGFNVRPTPQIRALAKDENVDMRFYDIIYDVINDIKSALDGMMPSTFHEIILGRAEVRETFVVPKMGTIAGCHISEGKVIRGKKVRLLRDGVIKCDTALSSLRRFKDDVREVEQGYECGIGLDKYNDIKIGDTIECYEVEERKYKAE